MTLELIFLTLFYLMGYRKVEDGKTRYTPVSPEMKEAVRQLNRYSNQVRLVCKEKLETLYNVKDFVEKTSTEIQEIVDIRQKYRNKLRNCKDENLIKEYKSKISECSKFLKIKRSDSKVANQIIEDIPKIKAKIRIEREMKSRELEQGKTRNKNREYNL